MLSQCGLTAISLRAIARTVLRAMRLQLSEFACLLGYVELIASPAGWSSIQIRELPEEAVAARWSRRHRQQEFAEQAIALITLHIASWMFAPFHSNSDVLTAATGMGLPQPWFRLTWHRWTG